ncbi:MAG: SAF domain-containing protein, partial [Marmoricola sp.]
MTQSRSPLDRPRRLLRRVRRRVLLHRRVLAALTAGAAVLVGLQAAAPPPPQTVAVWTARRDLAGGSVLRPGDLVVADFTPETVPSGAIRDPRAVVGRTLAAPLTRGEPLTRVRTLARGLLRGYPGTTAVPLRITDAAVVDLLRVGDRVSLVVADPDGRQEPAQLARDVAVVAIPEVRESGLGTGTPGRLVIAAVPSGEASAVAAA